jgi:alpha 1,3-glucosidase
LAFSVAGFSFTGADIPGFFGSPIPEDLVIDFYKLGAWMPFMRAHSVLEMAYRDPWNMPEKVQKMIREAIFQRYSFIHYM